MYRRVTILVVLIVVVLLLVVFPVGLGTSVDQLHVFPKRRLRFDPGRELCPDSSNCHNNR
ncbi:unnamed protein product [Rhodiola kirilowii]